MALEITDEMVDSVLIDNEYTVIDFWAPWCGPCRVLTPIIDELANEATDMLVCKLDVAENPISTTKFGVTTIPTIVVFKNGQEQGRLKGAMSKAVLLKNINELKAL